MQPVQPSTLIRPAARLTSPAPSAGRPNAWADVYSPSRAPPLKSLLEVAEEGAVTTAAFIERVLPKASRGACEAAAPARSQPANRLFN